MDNTQTIAALVEQQISRVIADSIDSKVQQMVIDTISGLMLDHAWLAKIESLIAQQMTARVSQQISGIDINSVIINETDRSLERLRHKFFEDFQTVGIQDQALDRELTVMDQAVVVENQLVSNSLTVETDADIKGTMVVNNLAVRGSINTDNHSWNELCDNIAQRALDSMTEQWRQGLVQAVLDQAKTQGIEFNDVAVNGSPLLEGGTLHSSIRHSQLQSLGNLDSLSVTGPTDLVDTVHVRPRRVGINTTDPEMVLSIWDEEVSLVAGKFRQNHAFLGTSRSQNLSIGVNRKPYLEIDTDGLVTLKKLRIDRHIVGFATQVPGYSGTRGDIVFNSDPNDGQPFAWVCLGAFRWQPLKAVQ